MPARSKLEVKTWPRNPCIDDLPIKRGHFHGKIEAIGNFGYVISSFLEADDLRDLS